MTCIVAVRDRDGSLWMGGDSMVSGVNADLLANPKVIRKGDWLLGLAGDCSEAQVIFHLFTPPPVPRGMGIDTYLMTTFLPALREAQSKHKAGKGTIGLLIAGHGKIWTMDSTYAITRSRSSFIATGSGGSVALGAMEATPELPTRERILRALKAAERWTDTVRRPFTIKRLVAHSRAQSR